MWKAFCKPQPVPFLLSLHVARALGWKESIRDRALSRVRKTGKALRTRAHRSRKDPYRISGANEFCSGEFEAGPNRRSHRAGATFGKSAFYEDRVYFASQSRPFLPLPFAPGTRPRSALMAARGLPGRAATSLIEVSLGHVLHRGPNRTIPSGFTRAPSTTSVQCKCGPVARPVAPTSPMTPPAFTSSPSATLIDFMCP